MDIHYSDSTSASRKQPFSVSSRETDSTTTSLTLVGHGAPDYSTAVNENMLHLLEHFAGTIPPSNATVGQLWFNSANQELRILVSDNTWQSVGAQVTVSSTQPATTNVLWYDTTSTSTASHELKIYDTGSSLWLPVTKRPVSVGAVAPTDTSLMWYNTSSSNISRREMYIYDTTSATWHTIVSHDASALTGSVPDAVLINSNIGGNAATSTTTLQLAFGRTLSLTGGAAATGVFNGSSNLDLVVTDLNASVLTSGTISASLLGASGTRAAGYYLDGGTNAWTVLPAMPDSYTKTEFDTLLATKPSRDSITAIGFASNNTDLPYMRRESDNGVYYLQRQIGYTTQPALGFTPVRQSTANVISMGWNGSGIATIVDSTSMGKLVTNNTLARNPAAGSNEFGWWKCGDTGLIHAWGISPRIQPGQSIAVSFPIAFTTGRPMVTMGWYNDGLAEPGSDPTEVGAAMTSVSNTGFVIYARRFYGSKTDWMQFMYRAIGW